MPALLWLLSLQLAAQDWSLQVEQITFGPKHHVFGYIGHVRNMAFNGDGRYIVSLRMDFQNRMPKADDAAEIVLIDTKNGYRESIIDRTRAWNFQQGTMFYWNPKMPKTELIFNDRDPQTGKVFAVLFDIAKMKRIREYRYDDTPFGNSGVAQNGGSFLGINYGRLAKLRPVTGYPESFDWTGDTDNAPENDGVFIADITTGQKRLLVSFKQLADVIRPVRPDVDTMPLFINHTLWSRTDARIYFFVRGSFEVKGKRIDIPFTIHPDGTGLTMHSQHIGGHPEWESATGIIGSVGGKQVIYDVDKKEVVEVLGDGDTFPEPGGDVALSPDSKWLVNGYRKGHSNYYIVYRRADKSWKTTEGYPHPGRTSGELRVDAAPTWNRTSDAILFPAVDPSDDSRQLFLLRIQTAKK
ncbi:MAG: hypothetical protein JNK87_09795 [Bryobacterales bacterium]|nr:hypothetical protein [Bryobacterales bacterium]